MIALTFCRWKQLEKSNFSFPISECKDMIKIYISGTPSPKKNRKFAIDLISYMNFIENYNSTIYKNANVISIVMGVNEQTLSDGDADVAAAPEEVTCTALLLKVLNDTFGISRAFFTATKSGTDSPALADADTARLIGQVLPDLRGLVDGNALAVAPGGVDFVTVTAELQTPVTAPEVRDTFRRHAAGPLEGLMAFRSEPVAASEVAGLPHSAIFDASAARVIGNNLVQVTAFYDNESCHQSRILELLKYVKSYE